MNHICWGNQMEYQEEIKIYCNAYDVILFVFINNHISTAL